MPTSDSHKRAATVLGWIAGGSLGLILSAAVRAVVGESYPLAAGNALGFSVGAFAGMGLSDRYGKRSLKPLAMVTGLLLSLGIYLVLAVLAGGSG